MLVVLISGTLCGNVSCSDIGGRSGIIGGIIRVGGFGVGSVTIGRIGRGRGGRGRMKGRGLGGK